MSTPDRSNSRGNAAAGRQRFSQTALFAGIALVAFIAALAVLLLMLERAEMLVRFGLAGNLYYLVLVPLGICVAAFLFGVLRSYAVYSGQVAGGKLELGGPIVGFLLVLILGFVLVPNPATFATTIFVHGEAGRDDVVLRNRGSVWLDLGGDRRRAAIGDQGQAYFSGIPGTFRGQRVGIGLDAEGYEPVAADRAVKLDSEGVYLSVRPKAALLTGYVRAAAEGQPIEGATVSVAGHSVSTDSSCWREVHRRFHVERQSKAEIARQLGLDRKTVRTIPQGPAWQPYRRADRTDTLLREHTEYLERRAPLVQYSARILFQELRRERGYRGSYVTVTVGCP